jgi:hypothetical protein
MLILKLAKSWTDSVQASGTVETQNIAVFLLSASLWHCADSRVNWLLEVLWT